MSKNIIIGIISAIVGILIGGIAIWCWDRQKYMLLRRSLMIKNTRKWEFPED